MTSSLTDRYVNATVRSLDDEQRAEVERELRTTIEDMIDGRLQAGAPSRPDAEREVLVELGDPVRLAAGYSGPPAVPHRPHRLPAVAPGAHPAAPDAAPAGGGDQPGRAPLRRRRRDRRHRPGGRRSPHHRVHRRRQRGLLGDGRVRARRAGAGHRRRARLGPRPAARRRHGIRRARRDRGLGRVPRRCGAGDPLAADQLAGDLGRRVRAGARPGAVVGCAALAAARARRPGGRGGRRLPARSLDHPRWPPRRSRSTSRSPCRCCSCCGPAPSSTRPSSTCSSRAAGRTPSAT